MQQMWTVFQHAGLITLGCGSISTSPSCCYQRWATWDAGFSGPPLACVRHRTTSSRHVIAPRPVVIPPYPAPSQTDCSDHPPRHLRVFAVPNPIVSFNDRRILPSQRSTQCRSTSRAGRVGHCLCHIFSLPSRLRYRLCRVFPLLSCLRNCLCLVFLPPLWLRHCLCRVFVAARALSLPCVSHCRRS